LPFKAVCIATRFKSKEKTGESGALIDFKKKNRRAAYIPAKDD
jgi:hypothetical protein